MSLGDHNYATHSLEPHLPGSGVEESLELKVCDETQEDKDKDYYLMDAALIGQLECLCTY